MTRVMMPNRRQSWRRKFKFPDDPNRPGMTYFGTVSFYGGPSWMNQQIAMLEPNFKRPYEVFLDSSKSTSDAGILSEAAAIYASFALQHGCSLEALVAAGPKNEKGEPAEPVGHFLKLIQENKVVTDDA